MKWRKRRNVIDFFGLTQLKPGRCHNKKCEGRNFYQ